MGGVVSCAPLHHSNGEQISYTVRHGETLYLLAWRYGLDYKQLAQWNGLRSPYTLAPGQQLRLNPRSSSPSVPRRSRFRKATKSPAPKAVVPARQPAKPTHSPPPPSVARNTPKTGQEPLNKGSLVWMWPLRGNLLKEFSVNGTGKKGIDIAGIPGQSIKAASAGQVVYSGSGLLGYGQLIIIKHNSKFLSAYAHNRKLLAKEGDQVESGQKIAELGSTGTDKPKLHFEIRRLGKPVDPLKYLPKLE